MSKVRTTSIRRRARSSVVAVALVGSLLAAGVVFGEVAASPHDCCPGRRPYASIYRGHLSQLEVVLASGDGQAYTALAQDPLLQRPAVLGGPGEFAYRAQRPGWAFLAWAGSLGQPSLTGWVLAVLTILSCSAACAAAAQLLVDRGVSGWWGLGICVAGLDSLTELTPELLAFALAAVGIRLWRRDRRAPAVVALCCAVATRETMLVAVAGLALWEVCCGADAGSVRARIRRALPLLSPFAVYAGWSLVVHARVGAWPTDAAGSRAGIPGSGLIEAFTTSSARANLALWVALALAMVAIGLALARRDVLTWIVAGYLLFASTMAPVVWGERAGFTRALLPLYGFGLVVSVAAIQRQRASTHAAAGVRVAT